MNFAPFSFLNAGAAGAFTPASISDLTFWVDFSNSSTMTLSGSLITSVTSSFVSASISISHELTRVNTSNSYYTLTSSISNPSLNSALVTAMPTTYTDSNWNNQTGTGPYYIVQGPKTNTTSYPDGMTFMAINRIESSSYDVGYLLTRLTNSNTDKGAYFSENRAQGTTGVPNTPFDTIGIYDFGGGILYATGSNNSGSVIVTRENEGATRRVYLGTTLVGSGGSNDTQDMQTRQFHNIGKFGSPTTGTDTTPINTYYCEIIQYNRVLTSTERNQVINYLSNKWNIT